MLPFKSFLKEFCAEIKFYTCKTEFEKRKVLNLAKLPEFSTAAFRNPRILSLRKNENLEIILTQRRIQLRREAGQAILYFFRGAVSAHRFLNFPKPFEILRKFDPPD